MRRVYSTDEDLTDRERKNLLILEAIRRQRETTKTEISKLTKINIVTISNYVNHFIEEGLVIEDDDCSDPDWQVCWKIENSDII